MPGQDLKIFHEGYLGKLLQSFCDSNGKSHTTNSRFKVIQRLLIELFTLTGSAPYRSTRGSSLPDALKLGVINTTMDVNAYISRALAECKPKLQGEELQTWPDDEKFKDAYVQRVSVGRESVVVYIAFQTEKDITEVVEFALPSLSSAS